jgi:hypothetical protein
MSGPDEPVDPTQLVGQVGFSVQTTADRQQFELTFSTLERGKALGVAMDRSELATFTNGLLSALGYTLTVS